MEYSEKHLLLQEYFEIDNPKLIKELNPHAFEFNEDEYKVLTQEEFNQSVSNELDYICDEVQYHIEQIDVEMRKFMSITPNKKVIKEEILDYYEDYIGTGTGEIYQDHYIFLMQ